MLKLGKTMSEAVSSGPVDRKAWFIMVLSRPMPHETGTFCVAKRPCGNLGLPKTGKNQSAEDFTDSKNRMQERRDQIKWQLWFMMMIQWFSDN